MAAFFYVWVAPLHNCHPEERERGEAEVSATKDLLFC
jgi:hypothetical protein